VAEVADLFNQLHEADPKRAVELSRQVRGKVSAKTGTKLDGLERQVEEKPTNGDEQNSKPVLNNNKPLEEQSTRSDTPQKTDHNEEDAPQETAAYQHDFAIASDITEKQKPSDPSVYARMVIGQENDLLAAKQRMSPHLTNNKGDYRYVPADGSVQDQFQQDLRDNGKLKNPDPGKYVVLRDPSDGNYRVWNRSEETQESTLLGAARVFTGGVLPTILGKAGKAISIPKAGAASGAAKGKIIAEANRKFGQWVGKVSSGGRKATNETVRLGEMTPEIKNFLKSKGVAHQSNDILVRDKEVQHMLRDIKKARGQAVPEDVVGRMPEAISNPKAVLWDKQDPALLYVFEVPGETRKGKYVVRVDMKDKVHLPGSNSSEKIRSNFVRTGGLVEDYNLIATVKYDVVKGGLD
jgi:hypothetical protein